MTETSERTKRALETFEQVTCTKQEFPKSPLMDAARDFVFGEVWSRPGLDRRSRRWITLACVCAARTPMPMRAYMKSALDSGDVTEAEMREFLLHFAAFQGFPKAVEAEVILGEILAERGSK
jgi:4-carboxymuconolactone decarboxylase